MIDFRAELQARDYRLLDDGSAVIVISENDKQEREWLSPQSETIARRYESLQVAYIQLVKNREH